MTNRLALESSPYLLQHSDNPVDWYPWGEEALERARLEDRPILLSVGYSACHWCHVMEHESFADPETAALMNELFVNVKVDREERPDVDAVYMLAVQQMSGQGGWPMTAFLTPDGSPFYGGTYFPPEPRHGLPAFRQILSAVAAAYHDRRDEVDRGARDVREAIERGMRASFDQKEIGEAQLHRAFHGLARHFDAGFGGFGGAPKFPQPMALDFLLRYWARTGSTQALAMVTDSLDAMARGGIHDQVGGGFHRYSVDARWFVPHFEKMLYDNALLARVLARAAQASGDADLRRVAESTLDYLLCEMRHESGGFFSSQDADSEGEEGRFYVWTEDEVDELLGPEDAPLVRLFYGVTAEGNWDGRNILHRSRTMEDAAAAADVTVERMIEAVNGARELLYEARSRRVWPGLDDKVITGWNALAMHAFAEAGRIFARPDYIEAAIANAEFLLRDVRIDGVLHRTWRDGVAKIPGFLEDHAMLVDALLELYRATFDIRWVRVARSIADDMIRLFWAPDEETFYDAAAGSDGLIVRPRDINDNATPSGTSAAAQALTRLARLTGGSEYERIATTVVRGLGDVASRVPRGFGHLLGAVITQLTPPMEVAIVGDPGETATRALLEVLDARFMPATVVALTSQATDESADAIPLLAGRQPLDGKPTAFVCQHYSCRLPVSTPADLTAELDRVLATPEERV